MCYHKQNIATADALSERYNASIDSELEVAHYENGFDFGESPIITAESKSELQPYNWGLVPWWTKSQSAALQIRLRTLNAKSEEMYGKPSYRDSVKEGKRCLVPSTGFFEWRWLNGGKQKYPYYIFLKDEKIFSLAGIYSTWKDKTSEEEMNTYSVLTTEANELMEKIHNSKKRMPVIIPREYEQDWLNQDLSKEDVLALCQPLDYRVMDAYPISKMITSRKIDRLEKNVPELYKRFDYPELALIDS